MEVFERVIEEKEQLYPEINYEIKDNVVMENDVRERASRSPLKPSQKEIDETVAKLRNSVEWQKTSPRFKYFIMFRHGDIFNDSELKIYFRSELERIKRGYAARKEEVIKFGGFMDKGDYSDINWAENLSQDKVELLCSIRDNPDRFNLSNQELNLLDKITEELTLYLNKLS